MRERKRPLPTVEYLRERLRYDLETGVLYWKPRPLSDFIDERAFNIWNTRYADAASGYIRVDGYVAVNVSGDILLAHRIVWAMHHGAWPTGDLDHINGNTGDNRLVNLRDGPTAQNMKNRRMSSANTSGVCGVYWHVRQKKWHASIKSEGENHFLGLFSDLTEAAQVRRAAEQKFGFTERHGATS